MRKLKLVEISFQEKKEIQGGIAPLVILGLILFGIGMTSVGAYVGYKETEAEHNSN